jgi:hypothetical protein
MNDYDTYEDVFDTAPDDKSPLFSPTAAEEPLITVDFEEPSIAALPRVLLMGPRRGGKTSIQVRRVTGIRGSTKSCLEGL